MNHRIEAIAGIQPNGWSNLAILGLAVFAPLAILFGARVALKALVLVYGFIYLSIVFALSQ